jgi:hypothetical protein
LSKNPNKKLINTSLILNAKENSLIIDSSDTTLSDTQSEHAKASVSVTTNYRLRE